MASAINTGSILKWNTVNYAVNLGSRFVFTVILQRLLEPADFGIIASIMVFTGVAQIIVDNGFQTAIVQATEIKSDTLATVFFLNIIIGALCTLVLILVAPLIGNFFGSREIITVTKGFSLIYFVQSFSLVQRALLVRQHAFRAIAIIEIAATILAGIAAIAYALIWGGVWSLVILLVGQAFFAALFFWVQPRSFRPGLVFSFKSIAKLWKFGSSVFLNALFIYTNTRIDLALTGRYLPVSVQGLYSRGKDYGLLPSGVLVGVVSKSYFAVFARLQLEAEALRESYFSALRKMAQVSSFIFPLIYLVVGEAILIVLGEKWEGMIGITEWFIILSSLYVFNSINFNFLTGVGKPRYNLIAQIVVGSLRLLAIFLYFILSPEIRLELVVGILIAFALIENQLSFFFVNREKSYGMLNMMKRSYFMLFPAWIMAVGSKIYLEPFFSGYMPAVVAVVLVVAIFSISFFLFSKAIGMGVSLSAFLSFRKKNA